MTTAATTNRKPFAARFECVRCGGSCRVTSSGAPVAVAVVDGALDGVGLRVEAGLRDVGIPVTAAAPDASHPGEGSWIARCSAVVWIGPSRPDLPAPVWGSIRRAAEMSVPQLMLGWGWPAPAAQIRRELADLDVSLVLADGADDPGSVVGRRLDQAIRSGLARRPVLCPECYEWMSFRELLEEEPTAAAPPVDSHDAGGQE